MTPTPTRRLVALAVTAAIAVGACSGGASPILPASTPTPAPTATAAASVPPASEPAGGSATCPKTAPPPLAADATATVTLATEKGDIVIAVKGALGPNAAGNFVALASCGFFDGVVFHRIIPGFVIQAGDGQFGRAPNVDAANVGTGGPGYSFADDPVTTPYTRGTLAMANAGPDTNGSQFFIVLADLDSATLPPNYSVFGTVTSGMDAVDAIAAGPNTGGQESRALEPVAITKASVSRP